ncbi:ABC transporter ATP-binding protein [Clostridiaceae bacterium 14S0207]|nr:ABC transporter ATP-binding protein [Clostridiaceae bacterium 14S0207]
MGYKIENLTKEYKVNSKIHKVLDNINLYIDHKKITVILGKSGSGKTTILRLLAGLEIPTSGNVKFINDENKEIKPKIGMVFQESRLFPWLKVKDNITIHIKNKDTKQKISAKYIKLLKLTGFEDAKPYQLSGGMAHRVAIGRALAYEPHILLMDEPFAALDYFTRSLLQNELLDLHKKTNKGIIFVTHNIDEAILLAHKILIIDKGRVVKEYDLKKSNEEKLCNKNKEVLKNDILRILEEKQNEDT